MNNDPKHKLVPGPGETLSASERERLRQSLSRHMALNPVPAASTFIATRSEWSWSLYLGRAGAFAALVLVLGGGVSYAAESAVPGDFLYAIKRSLNEPVQGALAVSTRAQASWSAELTTRRLGEAEKLASRGELDAELAAQLGSEAQMNAQMAAEKIVELGQSDPDNAAVAAVKLSASLSAHNSILGELGTGAAGVQTALAEGVTTEVRSASPAAFATLSGESESSVGASSTDTKKTDSSARARAFRQAALEARAEASAALEKGKGSLSSEDVARAEETLVEVDGSITAAEYADASGAQMYKEALRRAQSLSVILKAAPSLKLRAVLKDRKVMETVSVGATTTFQATSTMQVERQSSETSGSIQSSGSASAEATTAPSVLPKEETGRQNSSVERILAPLLR